MVWAVDASDVSKSRLVFIDEGLKVSSQVYLNMLQKQILPWLTEAFENKQIFIQDVASAHTAVLELVAVVRQSWTDLGEFPDKQMWTLSSPDINPMDFAIWPTLKRDVSTRYLPNLDSLKAVYQSTWSKLDEKVV